MSSLTSFPTKTKLPDGPKSSGIALVIQSLIDSFGLLEKNQQKYGDIFYVPESSMFPSCVIFSDPKAIEKVFTADPSVFDVGAEPSAPVRAILGDNSFSVIQGERHRKQRKLLMPPFHGNRIANYAQTMIEVTNEVISKWKVGQTIYFHEYTTEIALRIILRTVFGLDEGDKYDRLKEVLLDWLEIFTNPLKSMFLFIPALQKDLGSLTPWAKFVRQKRIILEIIQTEITRRRANPDALGEDILSLLLTATDESGEKMNDDEVRDQVMTLLYAGHESTASTLAWSFYWLHSLPEVSAKLKTELDSLEKNAELMTNNKLTYLNAVISETLRMNPIEAIVGRQLKEPFELGGYEFAPGTSLFPSIYLTHQREDLYPEPKKFKPERFLERQFSRYEFIPFGGGHRRWLGDAFAIFEMKLIMTTILSQVELELCDRRPPKSVRRGLTFSISGGVRMKVIGNR
ncbi:MAG: cytochrome P450 [Pleurocapsa sp.]